MKRICLFAGYDQHGKIHDYVVYFLKELSAISDIYYMADNILSKEEKSKIKSYTMGVYGFNHEKYDFGSWQELIKIIGWKKLKEYDELILANDSVFGPLYSIVDFFEKIEKDIEWEVIGITEESDVKNNQVYNFLQSYFLVIKNHVFTQDYFQKFIQEIKQYNEKSHVVFFGEISLSALFIQNKVNCKKVVKDLIDPFTMWKTIIQHKSPFIKKAKFINKSYYNKHESIYNYEKYVYNYTSYNPKLITNYIKDYINIEYFSKKRYLFKSIMLYLKYIRKRLFTINIKKYKKKVIIFGITIINNDIRKEIFKTINEGL